MENPLEILSAVYLHDYVVELKFNTGENAVLDLNPMINNDKIGIYSPLKNIDYFRAFHLDFTLCWGEQIDVAPEYLYFLAYKDDLQHQHLFKQWGYVS